MSGSDINLMTPMEMKEVLDEYVVGWDEGKAARSLCIQPLQENPLRQKK